MDSGDRGRRRRIVRSEEDESWPDRRPRARDRARASSSAVALVAAACSSSGATSAPSAGPADPGAGLGVRLAPSTRRRSRGQRRVDQGLRVRARPTLTAKVGQEITWTNTGNVAHTVTFDTGGVDSGSLRAGATFKHTFDAAGHVHLPLQLPLVDEGHDHRHPVAARDVRSDRPADLCRPSGQAGSDPNSVAPDGRSTTAGAGIAGRGEQAEVAAWSHIRVPWYSSSSWIPHSIAPAASATPRRSPAGTSRGRPAGRRAGPPPRPSAARRPGRAARGARPGSRPGRTRAPYGRPAGSRFSIAIRSPRPASDTRRIARPTESGSNSTPTSVVSGNRRATAISQRPPPQATSRTRPPAARLGRQLGQRRERLLEEDRDVLGGDRLDRPMEARRPLGDGPPGPEELGQPLVVEAADDRRHELAAEVLRSVVVEEDRHHLVDRAGPPSVVRR